MAEKLLSEHFAIIVAHDEQLGIGKNGTLPWHIKEDMQFFRKLTTKVLDPKLKNAVIMGRKTWQSLPEKFRPLPHRYNIVLTKTPELNPPPFTYFCSDFNAAFSSIDQLDCEKCFVIGGAQIYKEALLLKEFDLLYVTQIIGNFNCDVFFPEYRQDFVLQDQSDVQEENQYSYRFSTYKHVK